MEVLTKARAISKGLVLGRVELAPYGSQSGAAAPIIGSLTRDAGVTEALIRRLELVTKWLVGLTVTLAVLAVAVGCLAVEILMRR